jgi:hypothetical protein
MAGWKAGHFFNQLIAIVQLDEQPFIRRGPGQIRETSFDSGNISNPMQLLARAMPTVWRMKK